MVKQFGNHIKVRNIDTSLAFYIAFGLQPMFAYGDVDFLRQFGKSIPTAPEKYSGVIFNINGALLEIADGHIAVRKKVFAETISSSKVSAMMYVDSVDEVVKLCKENKFEICTEPKNFPWGSREVVVKDPDGFVLVFIERRA